MHPKTLISIAALVLVMALVSCSGGGESVTAPDQNPDSSSPRLTQWHFDGETIVPLIAGQTYEVGTVTITNDYDNLYVTYETIGDWYMTETHFHIADNFSDIPQTKKGNPKNGRFEYVDTHNPGVQYFQIVIDLGDWAVGDELAFAAHAVVASDIFGVETGWAGCYDFPGNNWATWCTHIVGECVIDLPECGTGITGKYYYPGTLGYWDVELFNVPDGYDIYDGLWPAWCVQRYVYAYPNREYDVCPISVYSDDLPDSAYGINWEMITWVINHKHPDASIMDIQQAIWYFTPAGFPVVDPQAVAMVEDALANGNGYEPGPGEMMAVIAHVAPSTQLVFMEVEIGCE